MLEWIMLDVIQTCHIVHFRVVECILLGIVLGYGPVVIVRINGLIYCCCNSNVNLWSNKQLHYYFIKGETVCVILNNLQYLGLYQIRLDQIRLDRIILYQIISDHIRLDCIGLYQIILAYYCNCSIFVSLSVVAAANWQLAILHSTFQSVIGSQQLVEGNW